MTQTLDLPRTRSSTVEWPTIGLAVLIYGAWLAITYWHATLPLWLLAPLGAWLVCWQSSLQHEMLHGHPTRHGALNRALGFPPLALWLPYDRYRALHLTHHDDERLTDPLDDPESRYVTPEAWAAVGAIGQRLVRAQCTILGRLVIGPFWAIGLFWRDEARAVLEGVPGRRMLWARHAVAVAVIIAWLKLVCGMSLWLYVVAFAIPGTALMLIRSFAEHRAHSDVSRRTAVVEGHGPLAWLFLFNNLHAAHHANPQLAWYRLPAFYRGNRQRFIEGNGGLLYHGYTEVFRRFLWHPHDQPIHPLGRAPANRQRDLG